MSFSYLKDKFKKKTEGNGKDSNVEIIKLDELKENEINEERKKEEEELLNQVMTRINEIENDIPRIKVSIDTLKSQIQEVQEEVEKLNKTIKDVMMLYEVVSQEINPFKDQEKDNPLLNEIQELKRHLEGLRTEIVQLKSDLKLLATHGIDLDEVIYEVISEGR
ncbi:flagella accessory protein C [Thermococcus sp. SY098]|uniref:flagella accessory protein C n=1 Tax=Thermococcus sp. SY098 TaxID=3111325 RepID=UPI002D77B4B4|nr:flagella accessory protein C [Thermococcus sp. SY098]WRS53321.1 flagella accessory protein C [Thermococcus sp. SY098]